MSHPPPAAPALRPCPSGIPPSAGSGYRPGRQEAATERRIPCPASGLRRETKLASLPSTTYIVNDLRVVHFPNAGVVHFPNAASTLKSKAVFLWRLTSRWPSPRAIRSRRDGGSAHGTDCSEHHVGMQ
jgi:hypothetical protein